jgi:predicted transcriptional regulator
MPSLTITISDGTLRNLQELANKSGQSVSEIVEKALDVNNRKEFLERLNADYATVRADPEAWAELEVERKLWDATLTDGLDPDECWADDGTLQSGEAENG